MNSMKSAVLLALLLFAVGLGVSYSVNKTADWRPIIGGATACAGGVSLMIYTRGKRRDAVRIEHGCRAEYGPLELRIQAIAG